MGNLRPILLMGLLLLGYMMWVEWQKDYGPAPQPKTPDTSASTAQQDLPDQFPEPAGAVGEATPEDLPVPQSDPAQATEVTRDELPARELIKVRTDVLEVLIDPVGGTVVSAALLDYPVKQKQPDNKVLLLEPTGDRMFIAQSGLLSQGEAPNHTSTYRSARSEYHLAAGADPLEVPLEWESDNGVRVT